MPQWVKTEDGEDREWGRLQVEAGKRINGQKFPSKCAE